MPNMTERKSISLYLYRCSLEGEQSSMLYDLSDQRDEVIKFVELRNYSSGYIDIGIKIIFIMYRVNSCTNSFHIFVKRLEQDWISAI